MVLFLLAIVSLCLLGGTLTLIFVMLTQNAEQILAALSVRPEEVGGSSVNSVNFGAVLKSFRREMRPLNSRLAPHALL